jgi:hypothetical protein
MKAKTSAAGLLMWMLRSTVITEFSPLAGVPPVHYADKISPDLREKYNTGDSARIFRSRWRPLSRILISAGRHGTREIFPKIALKSKPAYTDDY